jgi:hypothetical protein
MRQAYGRNCGFGFALTGYAQFNSSSSRKKGKQTVFRLREALRQKAQSHSLNLVAAYANIIGNVLKSQQWGSLENNGTFDGTFQNHMARIQHLGGLQGKI